ncbi:hypothetical protein CQW23_09336 [Capsicum baccatum]|uniref:Defective in cullin neddylation protein n=1 Tax=Capsicum baccatum TaxID=33114 RepID=A0A2G2WWP7_CAPBA|nr:hypothetical protein CQW23_09336 [Capsicum baccatum]
MISFDHNISPMVPTFHLTTPHYALMYDLSFVDMHHPTQLVPFETNFRFLTLFDVHVSYSYPMELIPDMPQQWEARDEGEGLGIFTDQTMQMEPNYSDALATAMLPMPDTSEAGCSIHSSSEMLQTDQYLAISNLPLGMTLRSWAKEKGQKSFSLDTAIGMWKFLFAEKQWPLVDHWCQFLQARNNKSISRDTWSAGISKESCNLSMFMYPLMSLGR